MSDFFNSEIVQEGLRENHDLQEEIYESAFTFPALPRDEQVEHVERLEELLEKQRLMYTRLSLSDDPDAIQLKEQMLESVKLLGFPEGTDVQMLFKSMTDTISTLRKNVDR